MSKKKEEAAKQEEINQQIMRIKLPRGNQTFGILEQRLGGSRNKVRCLDGKPRVCRIPGRLKRRLWVRQGDLVIVEPWEFGGDEKGDIIYKYRPVQVSWLRRKGYLKELDSFEEF
ncbi:MAG: translation initiation factor eIF-1A [Candidatus Nanoarchaeia archaeon]|nr:translation initiation factor eIF-1A [Candidatus Nanoarchaeia archaeon]